MDLNDFLIRSNVLNIRLSRNLITQSHRDRFCEYINKWQLYTYNSSYSEMQVIYISILICYNKFAAYQWNTFWFSQNNHLIELAWVLISQARSLLCF